MKHILIFIILLVFNSSFAKGETKKPYKPMEINVYKADKYIKRYNIDDIYNTIELDQQAVKYLLGGDREGNGGDILKAEIRKLIHQIITTLKEKRLYSKEIQLLDLIKNKIIILCSSNLSLNNLPVDAINYPKELTIVFDCLKWNDLTYSERVALLLHETLPLIHIDDKDYSKSLQMYDVFIKNKYTSEIASKELITSSLNCDTALFKENIAYADFNYKSKVISKSPLAVSIFVGCKIIADELSNYNSAFISNSRNSVSVFTLSAIGNILKYGASAKFRKNITYLDLLYYLTRAQENHKTMQSNDHYFNTCDVFENPDNYSENFKKLLSKKNCSIFQSYSFLFRFKKMILKKEVTKESLKKYRDIFRK